MKERKKERKERGKTHTETNRQIKKTHHFIRILRLHITLFTSSQDRRMQLKVATRTFNIYFDTNEAREGWVAKLNSISNVVPQVSVFLCMYVCVCVCVYYGKRKKKNAKIEKKK